MIIGILLAAGSSSRFGEDKLLAVIPGLGAVATSSARSLRPAVDRALAVVRPGNPELLELLTHEDVRISVFPGAKDGMGASLAHGVAEEPLASGWVIALADMPFVRPQTVARITARLRAGALIAAPILRGRRGHPVGFNKILLPELMALTGDEGARSVLARHQPEIDLVECDDPGILLDIDSPADLNPRII